MFYFLVILLVSLLVPNRSQELYSMCALKNGSEGVCLQFEFCKSAKLNVKKHIAPELCGFPDFHVCCESAAPQPNETVTTEGSTDESNLQSGSLMSQVLESANCNSGKIYGPIKNEETGFSYGSQEQLENASKISNNIKFMAKIGIRLVEGDSKFYCGGLLLTENFVIMPAHCASYKGQSPQIVQLGANIEDQSEDETFEKIPISEIFVHPNYTSDNMYDDIAVVELVVPSSFLPACIWRWKEEEISKNTTFVLGHDLQIPGNLQTMNSNILPLDTCNDLYRHMRNLPNGTLTTQYCMGRSNITDGNACKGFIGGSLFAQTLEGEFFVIGMANFVQQCYSQTYPMIFTKLLDYKQWLESIVYRS